MQGKGARGRKRLVALCSVEGTKLLGGPCSTSGWGVLVEGLGAGERDLATDCGLGAKWVRTWKRERLCNQALTVRRALFSRAVGVGSKKTGRVVS
jgi:hypothetical protein